MLTDARLRNPKQLYSTLTRYIDQAADYCLTVTCKPRAIDLMPGQIKSKALVVAIEGGGSQAQLVQIQRAVDYAIGRGLKIEIITVKGK